MFLGKAVKRRRGVIEYSKRDQLGVYSGCCFRCFVVSLKDGCLKLQLVVQLIDLFILYIVIGYLCIVGQEYWFVQVDTIFF